MTKNVLMIAFHFPPQSGSSGMLRSLKFARYLPENGWRPTVLTVHPRAYERLDDSRLDELPPCVQIVRAFALDSKRHLALRARYPRSLAVPDRWISWCLGAIPAGLRAIADRRIDVIFSTYPIASAVIIGLALERLSGVPWVGDFRDPMTEEDYPADPLTRRVHRWIEKRALERASRVVLTTESTRRMYQQQYPQLDPRKFSVISNGYDEPDFADLPLQSAPNGRPLRLVHSGLIYPHERDPRPMFHAIARLCQQELLRPDAVRIELRGCGFEAEYRQMVRDLGIQSVVEVLPPLPYRASLLDAAAADALLLLQGPSCDRQIPAKLYEYLRLTKPILALTTHEGDTASLLRRTGGATVARLEDVNEIVATLPRFLESVASRTHPAADRETVGTFSRRYQAGLLAACFEELVS